MVRNKMASRRLVQPTDKDYAPNENGDKLFLGPYSQSQRNRYMKIQISLYMTRRPDGSTKRAESNAFQKWRHLVLATIEATPDHLTIERKNDE